ncbi:hypothetical protein SHKM778_95560 (plasmid) [Streptomyces sp. KM77-8]|uniref:Uncharacterized protein n=1 Tax=Streptomyces haneummycinicus TaxID=3074435 RepID=A0AAT9I0G5_9ACTN
MGCGLCLELGADHGRFEVGDAVHGDGAVGVVEDDGDVAGVRVGAQVDAGADEEAGSDAEAVGRVVVAADHDDRHAEVGELVQGAIEQAHGVKAGDGTVVDVAGHEDRVDGLGAGCGDHVVEEGFLGGDQVFSVEPAAQVPVRSVQKPHEHRQ